MNIKAISRNVGYALLVSALFMLFSMFVSIANGNDSALAALTISFLITFTVGIFPFIFVRKTPAITLRDGYVIIVLSWLLSFVFGMLPYALWGGPFTVMNAWFESVSGFTTTGATILDDIEALPNSLLFWRSSTHFIGGLGVVVFLLLIIPDSSPVRMRLTQMELSSLSKDAYNARTNKTVFIFAYVYLALVVLSFISYLLAGMTPFDAINHAFSVSATGGFSTRNLSIGAYNSRLIEGITMVFMYLSSLHFGLLYMSVVTRSLRPLNNPVLKFYTVCVIVFILLEALILRTEGLVADTGEAFWVGAFQSISIITTSGFAIADNSQWPFVANVLFMFMAVMCACAGSTSGGVKSDRVYVLLKSIALQVKRILHPASVNEVKMGRIMLHDEVVFPHILFIAMYGIFLALSVFLTLAVGVEPHSALSGSVSSLGTIGPAIEELGTYGSYNGVPEMGKFIFSMDMFLGRIEIYPVLAVIAMLFQRKKA